MARKRREEELPVELPSNPDRLAHALFAGFLAYSLGMGYGGIATAVAFALIPDLDLWLGHRVVLHNIFAALGIPGILCFLVPQIPLRAALLGYFSHLFLDILSPTGIAVLFPLPDIGMKMVSIPGVNMFVRSGVRTLVLVLLLVALIMIFNPSFLSLFTFLKWH
jgi:membrane-bound metal-dependent hydrolase YbcI (DUF457 family)